MSNDYFVHTGQPDRLASGSKARADAVNALLDKVEGGFDKLPSEANFNQGTHNYAANTGPANAYACSLSHVSTDYVTGQEINLFVGPADVSTSESCTLNVSNISNTAIKYPDGSNPAIGDIVGSCDFRYSGSVWHLMSISLGSANASAASASAAATSESNAAASLATMEGYSTVASSATPAFDLDGDQMQHITALATAITGPTTSNRTAGKTITVLITASAADRAIAYNASWVKCGYLPAIIPSGKTLLLSLLCKGTAETDIFVTGALEP